MASMDMLDASAEPIEQFDLFTGGTQDERLRAHWGLADWWAHCARLEMALADRRDERAQPNNAWAFGRAAAHFARLALELEAKLSTTSGPQ